MSKSACTIAVLTKNNQATLPRALESAKEFAEIIVCDGGSTDRTLDIARAYGARILPQDPQYKDKEGRIKDFGGIHNQALNASTYPWHFYLDSDEVLTRELVEEIKTIISGTPSAVWVDRKYEIDGKVIECAATYPTRQMRLFHKDAVTGFIKPIHERVQPKGGATIKRTREHMLVPASPDPMVWRKKWEHYIALELARRDTLSYAQWTFICFENAKVSLLYALRLLRNSIFCTGTKMPLALEWERHVYHFRLCRTLLSKCRQ
jgi:glycosyltransferase involved in cell wall biosynthesis